MFLIDAAHAAEGPAGGSGLASLMLFVPLILIMYFMMIRPQQKRQKEHQSLVQSLGKGDEVVTMGGIVGKVVDLDDTYLRMQVSDNTEIKVQRHSIHAILPKGTYKS